MTLVARPRSPFLSLSNLSSVSPPLAGLLVAMLVLFAVALAGLVLDPRVITGAPAWLKPLKFAASTAIYSVSFAWLLRHLDASPRFVRIATRITAATLAIELIAIFLQAARGTTSHFNYATRFDFIVFQSMALAILVLWLTQIAISVKLLRQRFADPVLASTLRSGMVLTTVGAAVGWLMTMAQPDQIAHGAATIIGAHTIGGVDGGAGLPLVMWSRDHGDLRAAHFFGLHALQLLPVVGWLVSRRSLGLSPVKQLSLVRTAAGSALGLLLLLVWQALRGQSIVAPDATTGVALLAWLVGTAIAGALSLKLGREANRAPAALAS